jgi:hypothetical protein
MTIGVVATNTGRFWPPLSATVEKVLEAEGREISGVSQSTPSTVVLG